MPKRSPTTADGSLPDTHIILHSPALQKLLLKPSKNTLCEIVIDWLDHPQFGAPHQLPEDLEDEGDGNQGQLSIEDLKELYGKFKATNSVTKKAIIQRIVERDWVGILRTTS